MKRFAIMIAGLALSGCASMSAGIDLESRFYAVAFFDEDYGVERALAKRTSDIRLLVEGGSQADREKIDDILRQISGVSGLPVVDARSWADANTVVKFLADEDWQDIKEVNIADIRSVGVWEPGYDQYCAIDLLRNADPDPIAVIRIPNRLSGVMRERCIAQELSHSVGILYDTDHLSDTVFSGHWGATELTPVDRLLFRIHADPRLRVNMSWAEAQPIVRQIISEMGESP